MIFPFVEKLQNPLGTKGRASLHSLPTIHRALCEASSLTAESQPPRGFVASRPQGATPPCTAKAAIPIALAEQINPLRVFTCSKGLNKKRNLKGRFYA